MRAIDATVLTMLRRKMSKTGWRVAERSRYREDRSSLMSNNHFALRLGKSDRNCAVPKKRDARGGQSVKIVYCYLTPPSPTA